jgi:predicted short-subunit dehydrogenase-like oxidoreductase (DUF2520 family)
VFLPKPADTYGMSFAVAGGGRVSASFVARLPRLSSDLGPVAAQSYRLASRIVNSIGAGRAAKKYEDLDGSSLILICAPVRCVPTIVDALERAIECKGKIVLLCESGTDSRQLARLKAKGAGVGSLDPIPGFEGRLFVSEGDREAVREAKTLVRQLGARVEEVHTAKMGVYTAGLSFGAALFTPLLEAAAQCFQEAGMTKATAVKVAGALFENSLRGYVYAGKRSWSGPLAEGDRTAVLRELEALGAMKPLLAQYYRQAAGLALELLAGKRGDGFLPGA